MNTRRNNMTLEDDYGERVQTCGNLYAQFSVVRQDVLEKRITCSSLSLYVSNNPAPVEKKVPSFQNGSEVDEKMQ